MSKDQTGECKCGTIRVDSDALRIMVQGMEEKDIPCFDLKQRVEPTKPCADL
jgi:heterodisulfide reductase subunit B